MENTVTISIEEFDELRNTFENSELKQRLENKIKRQQEVISELRKNIQSILQDDFVELKTDRFSYHLFYDTKFYFRKDKTPIWIKKIFNLNN